MSPRLRLKWRQRKAFRPNSKRRLLVANATSVQEFFILEHYIFDTLLLALEHQHMTESSNTLHLATDGAEPQQVTYSDEEMLATVNRVEQALKERELPCHRGSLLEPWFTSVRRYADSESRSAELRRNAHEGGRIARSIEAALDEPGAKEAIKRVTRKGVNLSTREQSQGKDALWELDLFRRLKSGGTAVRIDEPDLVVTLEGGLGDYAVACKKIYSEENVEGRFRHGYRQIRRQHRPGVVAFNLDDLARPELVWKAPTKKDLWLQLVEVNTKFINENKKYFEKAVARGDCDGVLASTSVASETLDLPDQINFSWSTAMWYEGASSDAQRRFRAFVMLLDRAQRQLRHKT